MQEGDTMIVTNLVASLAINLMVVERLYATIVVIKDHIMKDRSKWKKQQNGKAKEKYNASKKKEKHIGSYDASVFLCGNLASSSNDANNRDTLYVSLVNDTLPAFSMMLMTETFLCFYDRECFSY